MIITAHFLAGAALAAKTQNLTLGLSLAFLSHYFLDVFPHKEYLSCFEGPSKETRKESLIRFAKLAVDFLIGFLIVLIFSHNKILALLGGFLAILPDFDNLMYLFPNLLLKNRFFKFHKDFHAKLQYLKDKKIPSWIGILTQILIAVIALYFLKQP